MSRALTKLVFSSVTLFRIDGLLSFGFGVSTALFPSEIFGTAVDLKSAGVVGTGHSLMESALLALSGYYLVVGGILLVLARLPRVFALKLSFLVAAHHGFMAVKGTAEAQRDWLTGNPWWDVGIHMTFVAAYLCYASLGTADSREG